MADISHRDPNFVPTIQGVSSLDGVSPTDIWVNPLTHGIIIDAASTYSVLDLRYLKLDQTAPQTLTASPKLNWMTNGSVTFIGTGGYLAQDNSHLFFNSTTFDLYAYTMSTSQLTVTGWTPGWVLYAGTGGVMTGENAFNYVAATDTLNVPNITATGTGTIGLLDIPETVTPGIPAEDVLRLYAVEDDGYTVLETVTNLGVAFRINQDNFRVARNTSGVDIAKGKVVYYTGSTGNKPNFSMAQANLEVTMPAIGITTAAVPNTEFGEIMVLGRLTGVKTNYLVADGHGTDWAEGDMLYVDPTEAGALTNVRPTHPNIAQWIGTIEKVHATAGVILIKTQALTGVESGTNRNTYTIGDTLAGNKVLAFDGTADASITWTGTTFDLGTSPLTLDSIILGDSNPINFGVGTDAVLQWDQTQAIDSLQLGVAVNNNEYSGYFSLMEKADIGHANRTPLAISVNPVFRVYSSDEASNLDYIEMFHNQTTGIIQSGTDNISFGDDNVTTTGTMNFAGGTLTSTLQINVPTTTLNALILKTTDNVVTKNLLENQTSTGVFLSGFGATGTLGIGVSPIDECLVKLNKTYTESSTTLRKSFDITVQAEPTSSIAAKVNAFTALIRTVSGNTYNFDTLSAMSFSAIHQGTGNLTNLQGIFFTASNTGEDVSFLTAANFDAFQNSTSATSNVSTLVGNQVRFGGNNSSGLGTITTAKGFNIDFRTTGVTITNAYGLYIDDISGASSLNYSIYTGAGIFHLGDKLELTQADGNEYIDSLNDGYNDYGATTGQRFHIGGTEQINLIDGVLQPKTTNDIDLGTSSLLYKDIWQIGKHYFRDNAIYTTSVDDGYFDVVADTGIRLTSPLTRVTGDLYVGNNAHVDPAVIFDGDHNDGQIKYMEDENYFESSSVVRTTTSLYRRYYHIPPQKLNPGASGATWINSDANTTGGWQVTLSTHTLIMEADVHADWDGASDMTVEVRFALGASGSASDTVDLKLVPYYNGIGDSSTKTQTVAESVTVTDGTQYKVYKATFTLDWNAVSNNIEVGDEIMMILNLETDTSEIDNVIITGATFYYNTTHLGIESGDV